MTVEFAIQIQITPAEIVDLKMFWIIAYALWRFVRQFALLPG